ncbi:MAG: DUF2085 domain-containing protein [Anaerolineales bacterium]|nr:DUF2085 domain-containing protein [Anaerolineales bacterium]
MFELLAAADIMAGMTDPINPQAENKPAFQYLHYLILLAAGVVLGIWLAKTPQGFLGKADAIGYAVCHQIEERSFSFFGHVSPMCARCTGMYTGVLVAAGFYFLSRKRGAAQFPPGRINAVLILFALLWGLDGFNSYLHLFPNAPHVFPPSNINRMITGSLMGINLMTLLLVGFNQVVWFEPREKRVLASFKELGILLLSVLATDVIVLLDLEVVVLAASILSILSVVYLLTMVYSMAAVLILKRENRYASWWSLRYMLLAGFILAFMQIGALDWIRFALTHTWDGGFGY